MSAVRDSIVRDSIVPLGIIVAMVACLANRMGGNSTNVCVGAIGRVFHLIASVRTVILAVLGSRTAPAGGTAVTPPFAASWQGTALERLLRSSTSPSTSEVDTLITSSVANVMAASKTFG
jgi:hypothetical protein